MTMHKRLISMAIVGFLLGSTTAVAASQLGIGSATAGTIRGCVGILGIVRIVPDGVNCVTSADPRRSETPISWTQGGPSGSIGDVGPTGPLGANGPAGSVGTGGGAGPDGGPGNGGAAGDTTANTVIFVPEPIYTGGPITSGSSHVLAC